MFIYVYISRICIFIYICNHIYIHKCKYSLVIPMMRLNGNEWLQILLIIPFSSFKYGKKTDVYRFASVVHYEHVHWLPHHNYSSWIFKLKDMCQSIRCEIMCPSKSQATKLAKLFPKLKHWWLMNITTIVMAISLFNTFLMTFLMAWV